MGSLLRSEDMCLTQLYLQSEAAFLCISELGELGLVQFNDLNSSVNAFQRKFVNEVRRCDEMERKLCFLEAELKKDELPIHDDGENPLAPLPKEMISLEQKFENLENNLREVNTNYEKLKLNFSELDEYKHVLINTRQFFDEATIYYQEHQNLITLNEETDSFVMADANDTTFTQFISGVIAKEKTIAFERFLWRACRGNVYLRLVDIEVPFEDPLTGLWQCKCAFVIFFQGQQLKTKVTKICQGFRATLHACPQDAQERREVIAGVMTRIEDLRTVLNQTSDHRRQVLSQVAEQIRVWLVKVRKMKAVYHVLNQLNVNIAQKCLIGECWCPVRDISRVQHAIQHATELSGSSVPSILQQIETSLTPPTYNRTDKFTSSFQTLIDAYGIANYREINPTPFTIITFPFLFAIMFGDLGHGLLMFIFGLYLVRNEKRFGKKSDNEIWEMMVGGRYLIFFMGLFSIYTGLLYNECFSRSINAFGSAWSVSAMNYTYGNLTTVELFTLDPAVEGVFRRYPVQPFNATNTGNPYPFGMDPIWETALNKITFQNSYKMKSAVIVGLCQMLFGLILALKNHLYFKRRLEIFCEWIPQMLFLLAVIGYLCLLILLKWSTWTSALSNEAPSLLIGLINMFMFVAPNATDHNYPVYGDPYSNSQYYTQILIVLITVSCVPWMLLVKPFVLYRRHKMRKYSPLRTYIDPVTDRNHSASSMLLNDHVDGGGDVPLLPLNLSPSSNLLGSDEELLLHDVEDHDDQEEFVLSEIMIHQIIHTIEYCLSCISHTASYLRLWALSLAHAELSEVLWTMVMRSALSQSGAIGAIMAFLVFWGFSGLTVAILLVMEGLSAFLHALRLHWVEFQSKFYGGEGTSFSPFTFQHIDFVSSNPATPSSNPV